MLCEKWLCKKCYSLLKPQPVIEEECKICNKLYIKAYRSSSTMCPDCSEKYNCCVECGVNLDKERIKNK